VTRRQVVAAVVLVLTGAGCAGGGGRAASAPRPHEHAPTRGAGSIARTMTASVGVLGGEPGGISADRAGIVAAIDEERVVSLDQRGDRLWSSAVRGAARGWPWMGDGMVVIPTLVSGGSGGCVALDRATGARRWSYQERGADGVAVASAGPDVYCALGDGVVVAIERATGARRWRAVLEPSVSRSLASVSERSAFAVDSTTHTLALTVWFAGHPYLSLRRLDTGAERGLVDLLDAGSASSPVAIRPGLLAVGASEPGHVCTIDLRPQPVRAPACVAVPAPTGFDPSAIPVVSGHTLVITSKDGWVIAIDTARLKVLWSVRTPAPILDSHPVVVGPDVLVADWARVPWLLRLRDGAKISGPSVEGAVIATAADAAGGFDVAVRGGAHAGIERWTQSGA